MFYEPEIMNMWNMEIWKYENWTYESMKPWNERLHVVHVPDLFSDMLSVFRQLTLLPGSQKIRSRSSKGVPKTSRLKSRL